MIKNISMGSVNAVKAYLGTSLVWVVDPDAEMKALFEGGKQGLFYDPSDLSTMFKDAAGTIPVVNNGDPVGLIKDKSGNSNHATQTVSAARPTYRTDGILHWLQFDGVDDTLKSELNIEGKNAVTAFCSFYAEYNGEYTPVFEAGSSSAVYGSFSMYSTHSGNVGGMFNVGSLGGLGYPIEQSGISRVTTMRFNSSKTPFLDIRLNGQTKNNLVTLAGTSPSAGTGNLTTNTLNIMSRNNSARYNRGKLFGLLIVEGEAEYAPMEGFLAKKSGVTL